MPTDIEVRDTTATALRVVPEPLGLAYLAWLESGGFDYPDPITLPADGIDSTLGVAARFAEVVFPAPILFGDINTPTDVGDLDLAVAYPDHLDVDPLAGPVDGLWPHIVPPPYVEWGNGVGATPTFICGW